MRLGAKTRAATNAGVALRLWLARVRKDRRGASIAMMAAGLIPAIAALGSAIDAGRMYVVKSQLQAGVDAGALAGARAYEITTATPEGRDGQVDAYFSGNFKTGYMGSTDLDLRKTYAVFSNRNTTTVRATVKVPMTFMRIFGHSTQLVSAVARAEIQPHPLEVMVVLDNTGSLSTYLPKDKAGIVKTRMAALKTASKSFFDVLYQGATTREDLAIGMVTYATTVNVGELLTAWQPNSVQQVFAFNDAAMYTTLGKWPDNKLAWKGCVMGDQSIKTMSSDLGVKDLGAWDISRSLPGEGLHPPVKPWFVPPYWIPKSPNANKTTASGYYQASNGDAGFNSYRLNDDGYAARILNPEYELVGTRSPYARWFYDYYMGLNDGAENSDNDVITLPPPLYGYYDPNIMSWNFDTWTGMPFYIHYNRIPRLGDWKAATTGTVNSQGGMTTDAWNVNRTEAPNPNWTCPEPAVPIAYNRAKSFYHDQIDTKNGAIYPANGTLHHAGLLWGYRLLVRDDVFKRTPPTRAEEPKRALVFMTDGETAMGVNDGDGSRTWSFYGNYKDAPISSKANGLLPASELRFAKVCRAIQSEPNPPKVYIISLATNDADTIKMFEKCAPGHVYRTSDADELKAAFDDVASELIDLHLVQ